MGAPVPSPASPKRRKAARRAKRARVLEDAGPWHDQVFARFYPMNAASRLAACR